jgi:hypothetical protein
MKKITEAELSKRVNSLREKLVLENNSEVDEAWYDPSSWGKPDYQATTAQQGKKSQRNYAMALQQIKDLYNKAEVSYPPKDDIVRQRYGLPPELPPFDQWDGKMPNAEQADYLTRNLFGRGASADAQTQNTANQSAAQKKIQTDAAVDAKVEELKKAVTSLLALIGTRDAKTGGAVTTGPMEETMRRLRNLIAEAEAPIQARPSVTPLPAPTATAGTPPPPATGSAAPASDKAGLIQQCQAIMSEIEKLEGADHDPETVEALKNAQAAIDQAAKTPDEPKPADDTKVHPGDQEDADTGAAIRQNAQAAREKEIGDNQDREDQEGGQVTVPPAVSSDPAQDVYGNHIPISSTQTVTPAPANQSFGQAFRAARNAQMKKDPKNPGGGRFTWDGKPGVTFTTELDTEKAPKAPTVPAAPAIPTTPAPEPSQYTNVPYPPTPRPMNVKPLPGRMPANESVTYADDQTLARIVSLSRR